MARGTWLALAALLVCGSTSASAVPSPVGPTSSDLTIITTELSPAVMLHTTRPQLTLFGGLDRWGLSAPAHVAVDGSGAVRSSHRQAGASISIPVRGMTAPWLLVWFHGSRGWDRWDSPWLVVLQHRPASAVLDDDGLHMRYSGPVGYVSLMPLYGVYKPDTAGWQAPPAEAIKRCRFWSRALRDFPLACDETFRLDPATASVVVRDRFRWLTTRDAWNTRSLKLAPISPTLGLAYIAGRPRIPFPGQVAGRVPGDLTGRPRMPVDITGKVVDPGVVTAFGPVLGVLDGDGYDVRFQILDYITRTEEEQPPNINDPVVAAALARLRTTLAGTFSAADGLFHQDFGDPKNFGQPPPQDSDGGNTCWALMSAQYYCRALPYLPADIVAKAKLRLHRYFADWVLQKERYKPFRGKLLLVGPGIGTWGGYDDAGKFSTNTLLTLWTYAHYTGDWNLIRERWPLIKQLFITPRESTWRGYGRDAIAEMGDEAAPALAMARLAWFVGDRDTFGYAAYIFARELVHHVVKHTGAEYFVARQPLFSMEKMPHDVYLTNLWGDMAGWQIDGPTYPMEAGERQYTNRWVRFGDPDVARFHRDHLQDLDRAELDGLLASGKFTKPNTPLDIPHIMPSMVRLRSLLLDERPAALVKVSPVDAPVHSDSGVAAYCVSLIRTGRPVKLGTCIPASKAATGWAQGLQRDRDQDEPVLDATVQWRVGDVVGIPAVTRYGWKPPKTDASQPGGDRLSFGQIRTDRIPTRASERRLSWNTTAIVLSGAP